MEDTKRIRITGRAVAVRGNDIDTDRIIPARYLRTVVFDGLGEHAFEDDRQQLRAQGKAHPFDEPRFSEASILLVNQNFGCGSSREHAPQALMRWGKGIRAIVGESFAEIFRGNCVAIGVPCVTLTADAMAFVMQAVETDPAAEVAVDLEEKTVSVAGQSFDLTIPDGARHQFLTGRWDSTTELLTGAERIAQTAGRLAYFKGYA